MKFEFPGYSRRGRGGNVTGELGASSYEPEGVRSQEPGARSDVFFLDMGIDINPTTYLLIPSLLISSAAALS